jgi:hypothetical protein
MSMGEIFEFARIEPCDTCVEPQALMRISNLFVLLESSLETSKSYDAQKWEQVTKIQAIVDDQAAKGIDLSGKQEQIDAIQAVDAQISVSSGIAAEILRDTAQGAVGINCDPECKASCMRLDYLVARAPDIEAATSLLHEAEQAALGHPTKDL